MKKYLDRLKNSDAKSSFERLVKGGISNLIAIEVNELCELLQFTAYEMWFYEPRDLKDVTKWDVREIRNTLPANIHNVAYYSKDMNVILYNTSKFLMAKLEEIKKIHPMDKYLFYRTLASACDKELYTYRGYRYKEIDFLEDGK